MCAALTTGSQPTGPTITTPMAVTSTGAPPGGSTSRAVTIGVSVAAVFVVIVVVITVAILIACYPQELRNIWVSI